MLYIQNLREPLLCDIHIAYENLSEVDSIWRTTRSIDADVNDNGKMIRKYFPKSRSSENTGRRSTFGKSNILQNVDENL